jgi:hypothetical protein
MYHALLSSLVVLNILVVIYPFHFKSPQLTTRRPLFRNPLFPKTRSSSIHHQGASEPVFQKIIHHDRIEMLKKKTCFYNSLSRHKERFSPLSATDRVSFYSCGPTVYDYVHVGNLRTFFTNDIIKRWLLYLGYRVNHVCNLTDVDDKIIDRMAKEKKSMQEVTDKYIHAFYEDLRARIPSILQLLFPDFILIISTGHEHYTCDCLSQSHRPPARD